MWNFSTNLCEFFLCLCTNLYLSWLYLTIYWRKSCSWRIILAINIKITYNAIHQRHLMTGLRREISATMRLSWTYQRKVDLLYVTANCVEVFFHHVVDEQFYFLFLFIFEVGGSYTWRSESKSVLLHPPLHRTPSVRHGILCFHNPESKPFVSF